jgi:radical SAM superfamily enzyme YgiQ (UPF0313 family)
MKVLFIYPKCPETFWSFKRALRFVSKKAAFPPLGLLTVAAMLPKAWGKRLVDCNVRRLKDEDILWADMVFISAMIVQKGSAQEVIDRCKAMGRKVVAGGPVFSTSHESFSGVDHFVLNEAEITLPLFLKDLEEGKAKPIYTSDEKPDMESVRIIPDWSLVKMRHYNSAMLQASRGCPFHCEFCDIVSMYGHKMRMKSTEQIIAELEALLAIGFRGSVFFVDDNFIGHRSKIKQLLSALIEWQVAHNFPFTFFTEASMDLAGDEQLLRLMSQANFNKVFLGIETPDVASLKECGKTQNTKLDLAEAVRIIQWAGLQVQAGFIVGFDNDTEHAFDSLAAFVQETGVVTAMVGMLNALPKTKLWERLKKEGRLDGEASGDQVSAEVNFHPKMGKERLIAGYKRLLARIYSPKEYYARLAQFVRNYRPTDKKRFSRFEFEAFIFSLFRIGIFSRSNWRYIGLLVRTFFTKPRAFPTVVELAILGVHFQRLARKLA